MAECILEIIKDSIRPQSLVTCVLAALSHVYVSLDVPDITKEEVIKKFVCGIIKSSTLAPRQRSRAMPTNVFRDFFRGWDNKSLTLKELRLKSITLLALVAMLRPSDIAPNANLFECNSREQNKFIFSCRQLKFNDDGSLSITIHGNKNDVKRTGFVIDIQPAEDERLCPVKTLELYIQRTASFRGQEGPVFLTLNKPYNPLSAKAVSNILNESISLVGLSRNLYSAKSFRPTGATKAVSEGINPNIVQKTGRWKTTSVFFEHYVHSRVPKEYTNKLLSNG